MKFLAKFNPSNFDEILPTLSTNWSRDDVKVFVLSPTTNLEDPKTYYEKQFLKLGRTVALGEDVNRGNRFSQRTGDIWFQVRYDSKHKDAYRHSSQAQPLHTDGSYIPDYPSSTILICEAAAVLGGATTFIDSRVVANRLKEFDLELYNFITTTRVCHERSGDSSSKLILDPDNDYRVNYNYFCLSQSNNSRYTLTQVEAFQNFLSNDEVIQSSTIPIKLLPGDAVFWKDDLCLHGRESFNPSKESERFIWKCAINIEL